MSRLKAFFQAPFSTKKRYVQIWLLLGWARVIRGQTTSAHFGVPMKESPVYLPEKEKTLKIRQVQQATAVMSKYTPWESKCLVQALAAKKYLQRMGIESTLYLGTAKQKEGSLEAHAWLRSGSMYVTGEEVKDQFTQVMFYGSVLSDTSKGEPDDGSNQSITPKHTR